MFTLYIITEKFINKKLFKWPNIFKSIIKKFLCFYISFVIVIVS